MTSTPQGLAPHEGLELVLMKMGHAGPPLEPRRRPQAGKSRDPRSQNADSSPQAPRRARTWLSGEAKDLKVMETRLSAFWEWGSPNLPACGLRRGSRGGPAWPIFINANSRPSRGAKPRGADDRKLPQERPHQTGSRGDGEIMQGYLARFS